MNNRTRPDIPGRFVLFVLATIAAVMLFVSYTTDFKGGFLRVIAEAVFVPMQSGMETVSNRISLSAEQTATIEELTKENEALKKQVDELNSKISAVTLRENELTDLRGLLALKSSYMDYETTGAYVIGRGADNWFSTFTIDKGIADGISENMNVLAGEGLVGIVTSVGKHHATVRSIIDDTSNVSGMISDTGENIIVNGSLQSMTESATIEISNLEDHENKVNIGDTIVTSQISDKYVPGILIGYISELNEDPNGLTKSGKLVPVADFKHLNQVLVVLTVKNAEMEDE